MDDNIEDIDIEVTGMGLYSPDEVRDMIQASVERENLENPDARIHLLQMDELAGYLASHSEEGRQQLIIYNGNHYMAADILVRDGVKSCVLLDAANDPRYLAAEDCFNAAGFATYTACGFTFSDKNLQTDVYSCPLFAFDHGAQFAKTPDAIHATVQSRADEINSFPWDVMPPNFLWNMQSVTTRDAYEAQYPNEAVMPVHNGVSFHAYTDMGLVADKKGKQRNDSINVHLFATVQETYAIQQRDQMLAKMDSKIEEVSAKKKPDSTQLETLYTIREELAQTSDLSQCQALMQRFDASANPPKTTAFRAVMNYMRGGQAPATPTVATDTTKGASDTNAPTSSGKTPGQF